MTLAALLVEHRSTTLNDLGPMPVETLCTEIAAFLWEKSLSTARTVYGMPASDRARALWKLRENDALTSTYAAHLVETWVADDRRKGQL